MSFIIFFGAAFGVWKVTHFIAGFIEEQWLLDPQKRALQEKFASWWISVADTKPRQFAVSIARGVSEALTQFFGKRLFSMRSFIRSSTIGTGLLLTSMIFSLALGTAVNPWKEFQETIDIMKKAPDAVKAKQTASQVQDENKAATYMKEIAGQYGGLHWKICYCLVFFTVLLASNALSFFLSIAFSRLVLQEIVASGRIFAALSLSALNLFLVTCTATLFLLFVTVLAYPTLWFTVPLTYLISMESVYWLLVVLFGGGIAVWAFGNPFLQMVSVIAFLPCVGGMTICIVSAAAQLNRKRFHEICCAIILRCTGKKPISFIVSVLIGIGILVVLFCKLLAAIF